MDASESKTERKHWLPRFLLSKTFIVAAAIVVVYTLAGFFLAPYLLKRQATRFAEETLKCSLAIEEVRVNPYALTLAIKNFDLKERNGSPLLAFKEFFINFQVSSLWKWALTFADVRLDGPSVHVEVMPGGRLNLIELVDRIPKEDKEKSEPSEAKADKKEPPLRMILEHIALNQGRVVFTDRSDLTHASVTFEPLGLELRNFTTLPDKKGKHHVEASLPRGGKLTWTGEASIHPLWSEGSIEVKGFKVITAWEFLQDELLLDKPEGGVDLTAQYRFAYDGKSPALVVDGLKVLVSGLSLKAQGEEAPVFSMETIRLEQGRFDLAARELSVGQLALSRGTATPRVNEQGRLNFQDLVKAAPDSKPVGAEKQATPEPPWRIDLKAVSLDDLAVNYMDQSRLYPLEMVAARLGVKLKASLSYATEDVQVLAEDLGVTLSGVELKEAGKEEPMVSLDSLAVDGGRLDLGARQVSLERVRLEGGHAEALMEKEGIVNFERMLAEDTTGKIKKEIAEAGEEAKAEGLPWSVAVGAVEAAGFSVAFIDQTLSPSPTLNLENITLKLSDIHSEGKTPIPFEASLDVKQGGSVKTKGRFTPAEKSAEATIQVSNVNLTPVQPYVAKVALLSLDSGAFSLSGQVNRKEGKKGPSTTFSGKADILNLLVKEAETGQRFLAWKSMNVSDINMSLGPDRLEIGEVRLSELFGKLIIYEDQTVNLKKVLRAQTGEGEEIKAGPEAEAPKTFPVNVRRIRIDRGNLDFADLSLRPQFAAKIHELKGAIVGLSTKEGERAQVELDGRVDEYGTSKIQGQLEPFDPKRFTDVSMVFRNVEMTNLTPYSAKFAGYRIASGKLSLDLRYLIKRSELKGENQIILDKLTLGEKVDNPDAPNIPLDLALALLKDADDRIDIGLPVSGNLEDPQFSYGHLIWKALLNLFTKIITAPFRALGAMLGVEKEDLGTVAFEPGKAELPPPEQEKMKALSEALAKRPQLTLKIQGRYDAARDGAAMKTLAVRREIAKRLGREPAPGEEPEPVDVANPQVQQAVEDLVRERISPEALAAAKEEALKKAAELGKEAEKEAEKEDKAEPPALSADLSRELYTALLRKVVDVHPLTEAQLQELGRDRAEAIRQELVAKGKVDEGRLIVLEPSKADEKSEEAVASTLTLDVRH